MNEEYLDCQQKVIGYIFYKGGLPALLEAMARVQAKFFDADYRPLWNTFALYNKETTGVVDTQTMRSFLRAKRVKEERIFILEKLLEEECREASEGVDAGGFTWYLGRFREIYRQIKFAEIQDKSYQILSEGGFDKARDHVLTSLSELEGGILETAPEGLIIDEVGSFIEEVSGQQHVRRTSAIDFGLPSLDNEVLGLRSGDMCLVVGWAGVGKTSFMINSAVHMCFTQRKNVVLVTTETMRAQVKERLFSRITKLSDFGGVPVPVRSMRSGEITDEEKESLLKIRPYVDSKPHGTIMVTQAPINATMSWLTGKLLQYESMFKVDVLLLDDIRNMIPSPRRRQEHEEIAQLIRDFKRLARTHAGKGLPVVSPYHINREMFKRVRDENKKYDLSGLASSAEAERQTDIVLLLFEDEQNPQQVELEILKMRAGKRGSRIRLGVEFDYQLFYEMSEMEDI